MLVRARQRRTLVAMEKQLRESEPRLTAMFAMFARLTRGEALAGAEPLPRHRGLRCPPRLRLSLPVGIAAAVIGTAVALSPRGAPACYPAVHARPSVLGSAVVSCSPPRHRAPPTGTARP